MTATELQGGEGTGDSVVTATELQGGEGIASIFERTLKIDTGASVEGKRSEAVQAAGPIGGDAGRTSVSEGKVNEEESLDIT